LKIFEICRLLDRVRFVNASVNLNPLHDPSSDKLQPQLLPIIEKWHCTCGAGVQPAPGNGVSLQNSGAFKG